MVMRHALRVSWLVTPLLALGLLTAGRAQATDSATEPAGTPVAEPAKSAPAENRILPTRPKRERVMSDEVAATLATGMPKYNPPKPVEPKPEDEQTDLRETDKPRNGIIRLPKYVVKEPKPPVFREHDLHTGSEMTDIGLRRYIGLNIGNLGGLNRPVSLLMYQEKERLDNMADLKEDAKNAKRSGDSAASDYIMRESNRANYRPSDFSWNSDSPISDTRK
jgi:hypothetical protein